ncbi:MAG: hypothetical protein AABX07_00510 [Nanoarchaeota archaeon]
MSSRNLRGDLEQRTSAHEKPEKFFKRAAIVGSLAASLFSFTGCATDPLTFSSRFAGGILGSVAKGAVFEYNKGNNSQSQVPPGGHANFYIGVWNDKNLNEKIDYGETEKRATALLTEKAGAFIENTIQGYFKAYYEVVNESGETIKKGEVQCVPSKEGIPSLAGFTLNAPIGVYRINWLSPTGNIVSSFNLNIVNSLREVIKQQPSDIEIIVGSWTDSNGDGGIEVGEIKIGNTFQIGETAGVFFRNPTMHTLDFNYEIVDSANCSHGRGILSAQGSMSYFTGLSCENFLADKYTFKISTSANSLITTKEITIIHPPNITGDSPAYEE